MYVGGVRSWHRSLDFFLRPPPASTTLQLLEGKAEAEEDAEAEAEAAEAAATAPRAPVARAQHPTAKSGSSNRHKIRIIYDIGAHDSKLWPESFPSVQRSRCKCCTYLLLYLVPIVRSGWVIYDVRSEWGCTLD